MQSAASEGQGVLMKYLDLGQSFNNSKKFKFESRGQNIRLMRETFRDDFLSQSLYRSSKNHKNHFQAPFILQQCWRSLMINRQTLRWSIFRVLCSFLDVKRANGPSTLIKCSTKFLVTILQSFCSSTAKILQEGLQKSNTRCKIFLLVQLVMTSLRQAWQEQYFLTSYRPFPIFSIIFLAILPDLLILLINERIRLIALGRMLRLLTSFNYKRQSEFKYYFFTSLYFLLFSSITDEDQQPLSRKQAFAYYSFISTLFLVYFSLSRLMNSQGFLKDNGQMVFGGKMQYKTGVGLQKRGKLLNQIANGVP